MSLRTNWYIIPDPPQRYFSILACLILFNFLIGKTFVALLSSIYTYNKKVQLLKNNDDSINWLLIRVLAMNVAGIN